MAIDFYELGKQTGAKTPTIGKTGFEAFASGVVEPLEKMLAASKATTAALTAAMPAGVPIDKVPEELRAQVTEYLTNNKKAYSDATKVIASGINPQSQRYKDAVEVINSIHTKFDNLSNTLEDIALKRKQALDDPSFSPATLGIDQLTFENLQNGSLYSNMTINEDGTASYKDGEGTLKAWSDFAITKQSFTGQQAYVGALEKLRAYKKSTKDATWEQMENEMQITFDSLFQQLGPKGAADYAFADDAFVAEMFPNRDLDELRKNPTGVVEAYKTYVMDQLKIEFGKMDEYNEGWKGTAAEWDSQVEINRLTREVKKLNENSYGDKTSLAFRQGDKLQQVKNHLQDDLTFIKNQMGIPLTAQIFLDEDPNTGGYSYYIKKEIYDANNNVTIGSQKIQDALNSDGKRVDLNFNNFRFILESYKII